MKREPRKRKTVLRNALSRREKKELVLAALVQRDVFDVLDMAAIDPACFHATEESLWHFWSAIKYFSDRFNRLPNYQELCLTLDDLVNSDGNRVDDETYDEIEELLTSVSQRGDDEFIHADTARDYTYRLLSDRDWRDVQNTASAPGKTPQSVRETLEEAAQKAALAESLSAAGIDSSFPEGYENEHVAVHRVPYGVPLIDMYLDGGGAAGEIYLLLGPTGSCKAEPLDSLLLTPTGWTTMGEIQVGDYVIARNGSPTKVLGVYPQGIKPIYELTFSDGTSAQCSEDHLWLVYDRTIGEEVVMSTTELLAQPLSHKDLYGRRHWRYSIPMCDPVQFAPREKPEIDPWLFGSILCIKSVDECIPDMYKLGSIETRIALLRGLMDTNGTVFGCGLTFSASSKKLARDVQFMVESLGGTAKLSVRKSSGYKNSHGTFVKCHDGYLVQMKCNILLISSEKHLAKYRPGHVPPHRQIREIRRVADQECQCIYVEDREHLYLTNHCIVTHNTTLLQQLSISLALSQLSVWEENNRRSSLGLVYFVTYELPKQTIQLRAVANVADIPFGILQNRLPLSTSETLNDRDRAMFAYHLERDLFVPGEIERKRSAERRLNVNWRILDFSGLGSEGRLIGGGNLEEVQQRIDADLRIVRRRGLKVHVAGVFVDYLGMMARRHCILQNLDETKYLRSILSNAPDKARRFLSYHFLCPVFMAHQVSANGNALKPGVIPDKSLAAECKTLPENCDFVFVAAKTTEDEKKLTRINCQKARRADWLPPVTLQVQGKYARVVDVSTTWSYDEQSKQFLTITELDRGEEMPMRNQAKTKGMDRWKTGRMRDED